MKLYSKTDNLDESPWRRAGRVISSDSGFTSVGVVVSMSLVIALVFTSSQIYWVNSKAGNIQYVADVGALAAENTVAEFETAVQVADATILTMGLFGTGCLALGTLAALIPVVGGPISAALTNLGKEMLIKRNNFASEATQTLNSLQKALPFLATSNAVYSISNNSTKTENYFGFAILVPLAGKSVNFGNLEDVEKKVDEVASDNASLAQSTDASQDSRDRMEQSKHAAYMADYGNTLTPDKYSLYERTQKLAGAPAQNSPVMSESSWIFDYAFRRAQIYYQNRLTIEQPVSNTADEIAKSNARRRYYQFALDQLSKGHCFTDLDGNLDADFPLIPKNMDESISLGLYDEELWSVGSATSNTKTGFEYYYRIVKQAAEEYQNAQNESKAADEASQSAVQATFDKLGQMFNSVAALRLSPRPPGSSGAISFVLKLDESELPAGLINGFAPVASGISPQVAISAANLQIDESDQGDVLRNLLSRVTDGAPDDSMLSAGLGVFNGILGVWSDMLLNYGEGVDGLRSAISGFIGSIPLVNSTPLASWAGEALDSLLSTLNLQPADIRARKAVLVNTQTVLSESESRALQLLLQGKRQYSNLPGDASGNLLEMLLDGVISEFEQLTGGIVDLSGLSGARGQDAIWQ